MFCQKASSYHPLSTSVAGYCHGIGGFLGCGLEAQAVPVAVCPWFSAMDGRCEVLNNVSLDELASIPRQVTERVHGKGWRKRYHFVSCSIIFTRIERERSFIWWCLMRRWWISECTSIKQWYLLFKGCCLMQFPNEHSRPQLCNLSYVTSLSIWFIDNI